MDSILIEHYWQPLVNTGIVASVSEKSAFPLWPNPAIENVKIGLESFENEVEITVINNLGQTVFSKAVSANQKQFSLPVATWSTGLYSVTISDNENRLTQRLVKE
jgi:hypothetical protein